MALQLRFASHSETGLVRKNNQDSGYASPHLLVVADGMGGAAAGDLASAVAIDALRVIDAPTAGEQKLAALAGAIHQANDRIADLIGADFALEGMGTTVTGALFDGTELGLAHIGDSRAYLFRDGRLERLTHDHSWVQSLVDDGKISPAEAAVHPHRSLLLKVLNGQPTNDPDLTMVGVQPGDRLLFCSDGLCGLVEDSAIEAALANPDREAALRSLVEQALAAGGIDNITVIIADVVDEAADPPVTEPVVLGAAAERTVPSADAVAEGDIDETEDTIIGRRAAAGPPVDEDEARYNPRAPHGRRLRRPLIGLLVLLLVATAALGAGYAWTRTQFYVGAAGDKVAIYQGLADTLPGIALSRVYEVQPLAVADLPPYYQERVRATVTVANLAAARQAVAELTAAAKRCAAKQPTTKPTPTPGSSPTPSPSDGGSPTPIGPSDPRDC